MAGFNQKGPMNEGPMTGRGRGLCHKSDDRQGFIGRGCTSLSRGLGRKMGFGAQYSQSTSVVEVDERSLLIQVEKIEAELEAIKKQLQNQV